MIHKIFKCICFQFVLIVFSVNQGQSAFASSNANWTSAWLSLGEIDLFHHSLRNCTDPAEKPHYYGDFFQNLYQPIVGKTVEEAQALRADKYQYTESLVKACRDGKLSELNATPCDEFNRHYVWINDPSNPVEPKPDALKFFIKNLEKTEAKCWEYHFWTNIALTNTRILLEELEHTYGVNIKIHDIDTEIYPQMRGKGIYNRLFKNRYFTNMSDILRFNLIFGFGKSDNTFNVYSDLHVEGHGDISPLTSYVDYIFYQEGFAVGSCFLGARKGTQVFDEILTYLDDLANKIKPEWRQFGTDILTPRWTSIGILTMIMDKATNLTSRILPCPKGTLISPNHTGGWIKGDHGQTSVSITPISDEVFFGVGDFYLSQPPYALLDHPYHKDYINLATLLHSTLPDLSEMKGEELVAYLRAKRNTLSALSQKVYKTRAPKDTATIPAIHHRIWVSKEGVSAVEPDSLMVSRYIDSIKMLPKEFKNFFWCTDKENLPVTVCRLQESGVEVRDIAQFFNEIQNDQRMFHAGDSMSANRPIILAKHLYDAYRQDGRSTNSNDILRRLILFYYGGIYTDMGFRFERDISPLLKLYDYIFYLYSWQNIDHGFCAVRPQDPIFKKELEFLHNVWRHPKKAAMKELMPDALKQLMLTGSHSFMNFLDMNVSEDARVLCLPAHEISTEDSATWRTESNAYISLVRGRSWNGQGNPRNNVPIQTSLLNIFSVTPSKVYCYRWPVENPSHFGSGNIGEYLFSNAARRLIGNNTISTNSDDLINLRREDSYLVVASNVINSSENSCQWATRILKDIDALKPGVPVVVMCMGAQAADTKTDISIHPTTLELLNRIQKRRLCSNQINIGVRGLYTQDQLTRFGIESQVVGCPSLLYCSLPVTSLSVPRDPKNLAVAATFYSSDPDAQLAVMELAARYGASYYIQTEQNLVEWLKTPASLDDTMLLLESSSSALQTLTYEQKGFVKLFTRAAGASYFKYFVQIMREKTILPQNSDEWIGSYEKVDGPNFIVTTRIHGTIPALLAGKRALLIAHDSRTTELAETLGIPSVKELNSALSIEELYEMADPSRFIEQYPGYAAKMYDFLKLNGIPFSKLSEI